MLFDVGKLVVTAGINERRIKDNDFNNFLVKSLRRHTLCDWGAVNGEDKELNDEALKYGNRVLSSYTYEDETKVWIITEADRSSTCILYPDDY